MSLSDFDAATWRKQELVDLARSLSVPTTGTKADITGRIRTTLLRRSMTPTLEVRNGGVAGERGVPDSDPVIATATAADASPATTTRAADFFRDEPGESRSLALATWFANRSIRPR